MADEIQLPPPPPPPPPRRGIVPFLRGFLDAIRRRLLPTSLSSREIGQRLSGELRRASTFSARVEIASVLQRIRDVTAEIVRGPTAEAAAAAATGEAPLLLSLPEAKLRILQELERVSYRPPEGKEGTIQDLRTDKRLDLIVETNEAVVHGHAAHVRAQDPDIMDAFPAQELVRISPAAEPRNWPLRWMMAGGTTYGGRMIALKAAPVWANLGSNRLFPDALGNPYPPFAFNSGMDVRDISRREAESLGLLRAGAPAPQPDRIALEDGMQASADRFDDAMREALQRNPDLEIVAGVLRPKQDGGTP